jgi:hypothetical protein
MTYIRSLYPRDWDHFLERMGSKLAGIEPNAVRRPSPPHPYDDL